MGLIHSENPFQVDHIVIATCYCFNNKIERQSAFLAMKKINIAIGSSRLLSLPGSLPKGKGGRWESARICQIGKMSTKTVLKRGWNIDTTDVGTGLCGIRFGHLFPCSLFVGGVVSLAPPYVTHAKTLSSCHIIWRPMA